MKHEGDDDTNLYEQAYISLQRLEKETGRLGNQRMNREHLDYSTVEVAQNTEKRPANRRRLVVTQTPVKDRY